VEGHGFSDLAKKLSPLQPWKDTASVVAEKLQNRRLGFEGAWLQPRLTALFKDLRHGWESVPLQNSNPREFFRKLFSRAV
jgi:hypothetical protein